MIGMRGVPAIVDQPPLGMRSAVGAQLTMQYAVGAVAALMLVGALWHWRRSGRPTGLLLLVGGLFCSLNEALVDLLGHCFFPKDYGLAYTAYGYSVPWWVVTAYVAYFGGLTWLTSEFLRTGPTRRRVWTIIGAVWVLNLILEMPPLANKVYVYYGDQPFMVGGFPLNWLVINALGSLVAAVLVFRLSRWFTGARQALLVLVPYATYFASWVCHLPLFGTLNADVPSSVRWVAAAVSALLALAAIDGLIRLGVAGRRSPSEAAKVPAEV
ncbi:MAG TPA: hypothetical protein VGH89_18870 [Pseudonocardia sp.]|jgi:hypothetical protein